LEYGLTFPNLFSFGDTIFEANRILITCFDNILCEPYRFSRGDFLKKLTGDILFKNQPEYLCMTPASNTQHSRPSLSLTSPLYSGLLACAMFISAGCGRRNDSASPPTVAGQAEIKMLSASSLSELRDLALTREINESGVLERQGIASAQSYYDNVWLPFEMKVREELGRSPLRLSDPVGAVKESMFTVLGPKVLYNKSYNGALDPLDPENPRGQCRAFSQLAALLLASDNLVPIPRDTTLVVVYSDTHEFLGTVREGRLTTHEFTATNIDPCAWGPLNEIRGLALRVVPLEDSFRASLAGVALTPPLLDTVGEIGNRPFQKESFISGSTQGSKSGSDGHKNTIADKDPYVFSSGNVIIPEGDLAMSSRAPQTPAEYGLSGGVYRDAVARALPRSHSAPSTEAPSSQGEVSLGEGLRAAFAILTPEERRVALACYMHLPKLMEYDARSGAIYRDPALRREVKIARLQGVLDEALKYWRTNGVDQLHKQALPSLQKMVDAMHQGRIPVAPTDPASVVNKLSARVQILERGLDKR
jgi:hypothetical protein